MNWYKIVFKLNNKWSFSVFNYSDDYEKKSKLEKWKTDHITPYNQVQVIWHGEYDDNIFKESLFYQK